MAYDEDVQTLERLIEEYKKLKTDFYSAQETSPNKITEKMRADAARARNALNEAVSLRTHIGRKIISGKEGYKVPDTKALFEASGKIDALVKDRKKAKARKTFRTSEREKAASSIWGEKELHRARKDQIKETRKANLKLIKSLPGLKTRDRILNEWVTLKRRLRNFRAKRKAISGVKKTYARFPYNLGTKHRKAAAARRKLRP